MQLLVKLGSQEKPTPEATAEATRRRAMWDESVDASQFTPINPKHTLH